MTLSQEGYLLRVFVGEKHRHGVRPLYEWIVVEARARGLSGATVTRGVMGFGANNPQIHTAKIERLSEDLPMVVELVDTKEKLDAFLAHIDPAITAGLATMEKAEVRFYRPEKKAK